MTPMNDDLRKFLTAWLTWAEAGAPTHAYLEPSYGLCDNLAIFMGDAPIEKDEAAYSDLLRLFRADGLVTSYPFGSEEFYYGYENLNHHEQPERLAWVRKVLA